MAEDAAARAEAFKAEVQKKTHALIEEFVEGKISREQFHAIYERYTGQLAIAEQALISGNPDAVNIAKGGVPTVAVREAHRAKAIGVGIYYNETGKLIETLGYFDLPADKVDPVLKEFSNEITDNNLISRRVVRIDDKQWLLFAARMHTTVATLFYNEPSQMQIREMERLHEDFENANRAYFEAGVADTSKLVYPFVVFVQKSLKK
jgi:hypothetical protein